MKKSNFIILGAFVVLTFSGLAQRKHGLGMLIDDGAYKKVPLIEKPMGFGENLPVRASLKNYVPKIGDQGMMGTCTGWSSTYYLATMEYAILTGTTDKDEISAMAYDPLYTYEKSNLYPNNADEGCQNGRGTPDVAYWLVDNGVKRKAIDEASCGRTSEFNPDNSVLDFKSVNRLFDNWFDWTSFDEAVTAVCQSIVNKHPVLIGMNLPATFENIGSDGVFQSQNSTDWIGGHAMCVVGYDDELHGGCFIVANSWGSEWGDNGFVYITYNDFYNYGKYGFSFETELKTFGSYACMYGDCQNGYGIAKHKKGIGQYEGFFYDGEMTKGIYLNPSKKKGKGGIRYMRKMAKKSWCTLIYDDWDFDNPIGYIKY